MSLRFLPHTSDDIRAMLDAVGVHEVAELFRDIPEELRASARINLPAGLAEQEVWRELEALAAQNQGAAMLSFLGAGAYAHFVPAVVDQILRRAEFYSSYTPYQPEVSQGTLQAIFEFQTMIAMLFDLDVANASMYDGASATAEAVLMALRIQSPRNRVVLARSLHPDYRRVVATYLEGTGEGCLVEAPFAADGRIDLNWLRANIGIDTAAVVVGYPNFFGVIEDLAAVQAAISESGALLVTVTAEALALAVLQPPGRFGVEIAVGEGQSLGVPLSYGGPGVGLFASRERYVRNLPGRLVGETVDGAGRRGYVLTLATREQHIRREKATSNICTNHGLVALAVTVYLALLGKQGLRRLGLVNLRRAHETQRKLCAGGMWKARFDAPFFNEFALEGTGAVAALARARKQGVLAGVHLGEWYPELENCILVNVTEMHGEPEIKRLAAALSVTDV